MKNYFIYLGLSLLFFGCQTPNKTKNLNNKTILRFAVKDDQITNDWKKVLKNRMSSGRLDSLSMIVKPVNKEEIAWKNLIASKIQKWNLFRDSLSIPFDNISLNDSITILLGYNGRDDAFSYRDRTVCFDVTALYNSYGSANKEVNDNRIDRIFSHEFTHLLSKKWAQKNELKLQNFKDSILWECAYEGIGMYRSLSSKWLPVGDSLSPTAKKVFNDLYPKFTDKIIKTYSEKNLTTKEKRSIHQNLSRGSMKRKWGALPVGVWLAAEAKGDDKNLVKWVDKGPDAIVKLAEKYLTGESKKAFDAFLISHKN
jgi:hypothetical protein